MHKKNNNRIVVFSVFPCERLKTFFFSLALENNWKNFAFFTLSLSLRFLSLCLLFKYMAFFRRFRQINGLEKEDYKSKLKEPKECFKWVQTKLIYWSIEILDRAFYVLSSHQIWLLQLLALSNLVEWAIILLLTTKPERTAYF